LADFAHALETPTRVYRIKKLHVNGRADYYSPDQASPVLTTQPDEKASVGGQDLDVIDALGGAASIVANGRFRCYRLNDGRVIHIKRSKFHERQNYYWYGVNPSSLEQAKQSGVSHFVFVLADSGFVVVPIDTVVKYCGFTRATKNSDGTVRHYHVLMTPEPAPELYWSEDLPRFDLRESYIAFR
jgi:hypothetical protein